MKDHVSVAALPSLAIAGVFRVCYITKRSRLRGEIGFTLRLAERAKRYVAIAGQSGSNVCVGDLIHVKGCVLQCDGRPVLVVSSLDRMARSRSSVRRPRLSTVDLEEPRGGSSQ